MNALIQIQMTVTLTPCVRTLKDRMFVVVKRDILEMVETAQVKCHDAVLLSFRFSFLSQCFYTFHSFRSR